MALDARNPVARGQHRHLVGFCGQSGSSVTTARPYWREVSPRNVATTGATQWYSVWGLKVDTPPPIYLHIRYPLDKDACLQLIGYLEDKGRWVRAGSSARDSALNITLYACLCLTHFNARHLFLYASYDPRQSARKGPPQVAGSCGQARKSRK